MCNSDNSSILARQKVVSLVISRKFAGKHWRLICHVKTYNLYTADTLHYTLYSMERVSKI